MSRHPGPTRYGSPYRRGKQFYRKRAAPGGPSWSTGAKRCEVCDARGDVDRYEPLDLKRVCRKCAWTLTFETVKK